MENVNIGLIGEAGSGKDACYEILSKYYCYNRFAFADGVKDVAKDYFPHLYNEDEKPRWLLQAIGTKFREIDPEIWIKQVFHKIEEESKLARQLRYFDAPAVITDVRLTNEYEALKEKGFKFIRINVDPEIRKQRMIARGDVFKEDDMRHETENLYDTFECEYEISNNGTIEELEAQLRDIIDSF